MTSVTFEKKENPQPSAGHIGAEFLTWLDPDGTHNLVAMDPETGPVEARTFAKADPVEIAQWIDARAGRLNIYYTVNEVRESLGSRKPTKADIVALRALCADIDPASGVDFDTERTRILKGLQDSNVPFGVIVDSGGGFQALAVLSNKILMTPDTQEWAESHGRGLAAALGGDNVQNVDRLLRLPGPDNIPSLAKRAKGRQQRKARIARQSNHRSSTAELEAAIQPLQKQSADNDAAITAAIAEIELSGFDDGNSYLDLPSELRERFEADQRADGRLARLWNSGEINHHNPSGSEYRIKLAGLLKAQGRYSAEDYASLARIWRFANMHRYGREKVVRELGRDWGKAEPVASVTDPSAWFSVIDNADEIQGEPASGRRRLSVMTFAEAVACALDDSVEPLVEGWLDVGAVSVFFGPSNVGKTFVVLDLAFSVANGSSWAGNQTKRSGVLYVAAEGGKGILKRLAAIEKTRGSRPDNFRLVRESLNLSSQAEDVQAVIDAAREFPDGCGLVIIDTLAQTFGGDENSTADMSRFVRQVDRIRSATGTHVLLVHHTGKDERRGARGSVALKGAIDTEVEVLPGVLRTHKQRDRERAPDMPFTLESVHLGENSKGQSVTSAVARTGVLGKLDPIVSPPRVDSLPKGQRDTLEALQELASTSAKTSVERAEVLAHLRASDPSISDEAVRKKLSRLKDSGFATQLETGRWRPTVCAPVSAAPDLGSKPVEKTEAAGQNALSGSVFMAARNAAIWPQKDTAGQEVGQDIFN